MSNHVMRREIHCAIFNISPEADTFHFHAGIIRPLPGWDEKELDSFNPSCVKSGDYVRQDLLAKRTE